MFSQPIDLILTLFGLIFKRIYIYIYKLSIQKYDANNEIKRHVQKKLLRVR
jgi:hypothetical protein